MNTTAKISAPDVRQRPQSAWFQPDESSDCPYLKDGYYPDGSRPRSFRCWQTAARPLARRSARRLHLYSNRPSHPRSPPGCQLQVRRARFPHRQCTSRSFRRPRRRCRSPCDRTPAAPSGRRRPSIQHQHETSRCRRSAEPKSPGWSIRSRDRCPKSIPERSRRRWCCTNRTPRNEAPHVHHQRQ